MDMFLPLLLLVGAGLPALAGGMGRRDALAVGVTMSARGMVELVVLTIMLQAGVFDGAAPAGGLVANLFSALVITAVVTTIAAPILLRRILAYEPGRRPRRPKTPRMGAP